MKLCVDNTKLQYFVFDGTLESLKDNLEDWNFDYFNAKQQTCSISNSDGDHHCDKGDYVIETRDGYWEPFHPKVFYDFFRKINEEEKIMNYKQLEKKLQSLNSGFKIEHYDGSELYLVISLNNDTFAKINTSRTVSFCHLDNQPVMVSVYQRAMMMIIQFADEYTTVQMIDTNEDVKMTASQAKMIKDMADNQLNFVERGSSKYFDLMAIHSNIDNAFQPSVKPPYEDWEDDDDDDDDWD